MGVSRAPVVAVHAVKDAASCLQTLREEPIDLIVLDVMLPDQSGLQVCRQVRDEGLTLPILVISALGRRDDKLAALNRQLWLLARVVLHPTYRGAGIATGERSTSFAGCSRSSPTSPEPLSTCNRSRT